LQLQELEPQAWLTGAWQEPEEQVQLVGDKDTISGALAMKKQTAWRTTNRSCSWPSRKPG